VAPNSVVEPFDDNLVENILGDRFKTNIAIIGLIDKVFASNK
jgi:hypothetical protein